MELSVREAAVLTGRPSRTLRAQLARGELPGVKRNGRWVVDRRHLPLTEDQRRRLEHKAGKIRRQVDEVLPSRLAASRGDRQRSLVDLEVFRLTLDLHRDLLADKQLTNRERLLCLSHDAVLALAETFHEFDREAKLQAVHRARACLAHLAAELLIDHGLPPSEPAFRWLHRLERDILPAVAGLARFIDRLGRRR